jgi:hypothetical protein
VVTKQNPYDKTSSKRQGKHLKGLAKSKGRRTVVDLDLDRLTEIEALKSLGYGKSSADVIRRAIREAHDREQGKS